MTLCRNGHSSRELRSGWSTAFYSLFTLAPQLSDSKGGHVRPIAKAARKILCASGLELDYTQVKPLTYVLAPPFWQLHVFCTGKFRLLIIRKYS